MGDRQPTPTQPHYEGVVVLEGGRGLGYAEYGDPEGDPVFWFHGTPGARKQVPPDINLQARQRGLRVICVERPGTGLSTPHQYARVLDWTDDVAHVADRLKIGRFAVVGLSGGGPFVLACCHGLAERVTAGAVLGGMGPLRGPEASPGYTRFLPPAEVLLTAMRWPMGELLSHTVRPLRAVASQCYDLYVKVAPAADRVVMVRPELKAGFLYDLVTAAEGGLRSFVADLLVFSRDWGFSLRDIHVPVRFWHGDADGIVPLSHGELQAALVPGAALVVTHGGGHFSGYLVAGDVFDWISAVWPDRARAPQRKAETAE